MTLQTYSPCTILFVPSTRRIPVQRYSDRSLIELRQDEDLNFFVRAIDVDRNRQEIFNIQIKTPNIYKFGRSVDQADEVRDTSGSYVLTLNPSSRDQFHQALKTCLDILPPVEENLSKLNSISNASAP